MTSANLLVYVDSSKHETMRLKQEIEPQINPNKKLGCVQTEIHHKDTKDYHH